MKHATVPVKSGHQLPARTGDTILGELLISKSSSIPLIDLKQFSMRQVLEALDFLKGEAIDPDIDRALATYVSQFIFAPAGLLSRRPTKQADARLADDPVARAGTDVRYHDPEPGDPFACRGGAIRSGRWHQLKKQVDWADTQFNEHHYELEPDVIADLKEYRADSKAQLDKRTVNDQNKPVWRELIKHLLGGRGNQRLLFFLQQNVASNAMVSSFVIDLDDKDTEPTLLPGKPSKPIRDRLTFLDSMPLFHTKNALIVTSPSGRGRHCYYRIKPTPVCIVAKQLAFLSEAITKIGGIDLYPPRPGHKSYPWAMLPLCRGSHICDPNGRGLQFTTREALLEIDRRINSDEWPIIELPATKGATEQPATVKVPKKIKQIALNFDRLLNKGLQQKGQRQKVLGEFFRRQLTKSVPKVKAILAAKQWLIAKHNGVSTDYNRDAESTLNEMEMLAAIEYRSAPAGFFRKQLTGLAFFHADAERLIHKITSHAPALKLEKKEARLLLRFGLHLMAYVRREGTPEEGVPGAITAEVSSRILRLLPGGTGVTYQKRIAQLSRIGLGYKSGNNTVSLPKSFTLKLPLLVTPAPKVSTPLSSILSSLFSSDQYRKVFFTSNRDCSRFIEQG